MSITHKPSFRLQPGSATSDDSHDSHLAPFPRLSVLASATQFGYEPGMWGKPPVDEYGRPIYGDVFGEGYREDDYVDVDKMYRVSWRGRRDKRCECVGSVIATLGVRVLPLRNSKVRGRRGLR